MARGHDRPGKKESSVHRKCPYSEVPSVLKSYTVEEMLPLITGHHYPLAVVDEEDGRLLGLVTQTSLIIESTRYSKTEMNELIDNANDL